MSEAVYKLGAVLTLKDVASSMWSRATGNAEKYKSKLGEIEGATKLYEKSWKNIKVGGVMAAAGMGMMAMSKSMIQGSREAGVLKSNLSSLGLSASSIAKINTSAIKMGGTMGIAREEVLKAAYDIKSGIETIDDNAIGSFAESVAKAAVATKGDTAQFASLFGTIYNQNKKLYANLSDQDFGKKIANGLAFAVQKYKTDGAKMQQAIESVSGAAAAAGYDMAEQFNVLGMLQNVMQPGEAGTAFKSFVGKAGKAGKKLGMDFADSHGKLKSTASIMSMLQNRYGAFLDVAEKEEIAKAFGSEESLKLIDNIWGKTGKLKENIDAMRNAKGTQLVDGMAAKNLDNMDTALKGATESWRNLTGVMGGGMSSALQPIVKYLSIGVSKLAEWGAEHPTIMGFVGGFISIGGALTTLIGTIMAAKGALGLYRVSQMASALAQGSANTATKTGIFLQLKNRAAIIKTGIATKANVVKTKVLAGMTVLYNKVIALNTYLSKLNIRSKMKNAAASVWSAAKTGFLTGAIWLKNTAVSVSTALLNSNIVSMAKSGAIAAFSAIKTGLLTSATWAMNAATKAATVGIKLMRLAFLATPVGWIVAGIGLVIAAGVALYKNWDKVKKFASKMWSGIKKIFSGLGKWFSGLFSSLWKKIKGFFSKIGDAWRAVKSWFTGDDGEGKKTGSGALGFSHEKVIGANLNRVSRKYNRRLQTSSKKISMNKNTNVRIDSVVKNMNIRNKRKLPMAEIEKHLQREIERGEATD